MKIVTILGARPQFVKSAVVNRAFTNYKGVQNIVIHTGQHYDENMSDSFFTQLQIPQPDYNLNINGLPHGAMTGRMLEQIEQLLQQLQPDCVLVYGDTDSTLAGALAASKLQVKIAHVEAGLRSFNKAMPEEINRILTDNVSNLLFCPTETAVKNLLQEGFGQRNVSILNVGDVMLDAAHFYRKKAQKPTLLTVEKYILCTVHRQENTDDATNLRAIFNALTTIAETIPVVLPLHPRTKEKLRSIHFDMSKSKICFLPPMGYLEMLYLIDNAQLVLTDSGGLQKEAYFFAKKTVTMRKQTEWVELLDCGCNVLSGAEEANILSKTEEMLNKKVDFSANYYGNTHAADIIVEQLLKDFNS